MTKGDYIMVLKKGVSWWVGRWVHFSTNFLIIFRDTSSRISFEIHDRSAYNQIGIFPSNYVREVPAGNFQEKAPVVMLTQSPMDSPSSSRTPDIARLSMDYNGLRVLSDSPKSRR